MEKIRDWAVPALVGTFIQNRFAATDIPIACDLRFGLLARRGGSVSGHCASGRLFASARASPSPRSGFGKFGRSRTRRGCLLAIADARNRHAGELLDRLDGFGILRRYQRE